MTDEKKMDQAGQDLEKYLNDMKELRVSPENAQAFAAAWGDADFASKKFGGYWIRTSPDGAMIGFIFYREGMEPYRVAIPTEEMMTFQEHFICALNSGLERMLAQVRKNAN